MLKLKGCPRCEKGDIAFDRDYYGWYEYCIQCGYIRDLVSIAEPDQRLARDVTRRKKRAKIKAKNERK